MISQLLSFMLADLFSESNAYLTLYTLFPLSSFTCTSSLSLPSTRANLPLNSSLKLPSDAFEPFALSV